MSYKTMVSCNRCPTTAEHDEGSFPPGWAEIKIRPEHKHQPNSWLKSHLCPKCLEEFDDFMAEATEDGQGNRTTPAE